MERRDFIKMAGFCSLIGAASLNASALLSFSVERNGFMIYSVYNNIAGNNSELTKDWGLSFWIEKNGEVVLFDTGKHGNILLSNILKLGLNPDKIKAIVISHNHNDHIGGLPDIIKHAGPLTPVYVPQRGAEVIKTDYPGIKILGVDRPLEIMKGIYSSGQIKGKYNGRKLYEQSLVIRDNNGIIILTGCSHPPIELVAETVHSQYPGEKIQLIAGGYHLSLNTMDQAKVLSEKFRDAGVLNIAPSHCSGPRAIEYLREIWQEHFIELNLGESYNSYR